MGIEVAALAVSVASLGYQAVQGERAEDASYAQAEEQRKQTAISRRMADIKNIREQRDLVRRSRIQRAAVINAAANTGTAASSGAAGAVSSIGSQTASNLGYFSTVKENQGSIFESQSREAGFVQAQGQAQRNAAIASSIGNLSSSIFTASGGFKTLFS